MREYTVELIVFRRKYINEYDKEIFALTEEFGKLILKVKGVRKPLAKLKALTEPFTYSTSMIYYTLKSTSGVLLTGVLNKVFNVSYRNLNSYITLLNFFDSYIPFGISDRMIFKLFLDSLYDIDGGSFNESHFIGEFFRVAGVESGCSSCGRIDVYMYLCYPGFYCSKHKRAAGVKIKADDFLKYRKYLV